MNEYWPGTVVLAFDTRLYVNDKVTPPSITMRKATVVTWYGEVSEYMEREYGRENAKYPSLVDVVFHWDGHTSHGHFTDGLEILKEG